MGRDTHRITLAAVVGLHLLVNLAHGSAHGTAGVNLSASAMAFVFLVIMAGPLIGLAWMWKNPIAGARLIGITMAASLLFGLVNHFMIPGPDRVDHVVHASRAFFGSTAVMLVITEAAGAMLAFAYRRSAARRLA